MANTYYVAHSDECGSSIKYGLQSRLDELDDRDGTNDYETIAIEKYGAAVNTYSGHNVTPSGAIGATGTTYSMNTGAENWQLEITTRAAGIIETQDIERTIETTSTITSLSVFSQ